MSDIMDNKEYIEELRETIATQNQKLEQLRNWKDRLEKENGQLQNRAYNILGDMMRQQRIFQDIVDPRVSAAHFFISCDKYNRIEMFNDNETAVKNFNQTLHDHAEALGMEAAELINWLAWKGWTKKLGNGWDRIEGNEQFSDEHVIEMKKEALDCLIFTINICLILGMDETEIFEMYNQKLKTNKQRKEMGY